MKLYRSREGILLGVCQGLADRTGYPVRYFRIAAVILAVLTRGWAVIAYILAAILLPSRYRGADSSDGFRANCENFRDDAEDLIKKEYRTFKESINKK